MFSLDMNLNFAATTLGMRNAEIIENITNDVIANSMDKPYLSLSSDVFDAIESYKAENNEKIYKLPAVRDPYTKRYPSDDRKNVRETAKRYNRRKHELHNL